MMEKVATIVVATIVQWHVGQPYIVQEIEMHVHSKHVKDAFLVHIRKGEFIAWLQVLLVILLHMEVIHIKEEMGS